MLAKSSGTGNNHKKKLGFGFHSTECKEFKFNFGFSSYR
jgi:hypothetical protein